MIPVAMSTVATPAATINAPTTAPFTRAAGVMW
jgi:hypothetical protein